jgi:hypothetical protein
MHDITGSDQRLRVTVTEVAETSLSTPPVSTSQAPTRGKHRRHSVSRWSKLTSLVSR